jgi:hypothetical protein
MAAIRYSASEDLPAVVKVERIDPFTRKNMGALSIEEAADERNPEP